MIFEETGLKLDSRLVIREENKACILFLKDPGKHKRTKNIIFFEENHIKSLEKTA